MYDPNDSWDFQDDRRNKDKYRDDDLEPVDSPPAPLWKWLTVWAVILTAIVALWFWIIDLLFGPYAKGGG